MFFSPSLHVRARSVAMENDEPSDSKSLAPKILEQAGISEREVLGNLSPTEISVLLLGMTFGISTWDEILRLHETAARWCDPLIATSALAIAKMATDRQIIILIYFKGKCGCVDF